MVELGRGLGLWKPSAFIKSVLRVFWYCSNVAYQEGRAAALWCLFPLGLSWFLRLCLLSYKVRAWLSVRREYRVRTSDYYGNFDIVFRRQGEVNRGLCEATID